MRAKDKKMLGIAAVVGVAAYFLFGKGKAQAATAHLSPVAAGPTNVLMQPGTMTIAARPEGLMLNLPTGASWVGQSSPTLPLLIPSKFSPAGTYTWTDATGAQQTTTIVTP